MPPSTPQTGAASETRARAAREDARTLCIDVGGSSIKAAVVEPDGALVGERARVETPQALDRATLLDTLEALPKSLPEFQRISLGVPGIVHRGVIYAIPISGNPELCGFNVAVSLAARLDAPVRVLNDAEMHGLGAVSGEGVEMVITLGTGLGTALFIHGELGPRWHITDRPTKKSLPGGPYGKLAHERVGDRKWKRRVERLVERLRELTHFDRLYIGGGEAEQLDISLPDDVTLIDNDAALLGAARLWQWRLGPYVPLPPTPGR